MFRLRIFALISVLQFAWTTSWSQPGTTHEQPIWVKDAVAFDRACSDQGGVGQRIYSPDHTSSAEIHCHIDSDGDSIISLTLRSPHGFSQKVTLNDGAHELLWSPDSKAFFVDGSTGASTGFFTDVYWIGNDGLQKVTVTQSAQKDMVKIFPPCKAGNRDPQVCKQLTGRPEYNMSAIAWVRGSEAIVVMAEIPCVSWYGGIMCQVQGYELAARDGTIIRRMNASELKRDWQSRMAWNMWIPNPPDYGNACQTFSCK